MPAGQRRPCAKPVVARSLATLCARLRLMDERGVLQQLIKGPVSGDALAQACGQTRAAVWKRIQALREAGVAIDAKPGRGYRLAQPMELLDADAIRRALPVSACTAIAGLEVAWALDSTNSELLRRRPAPAGAATVLLAERQTAGRGRRGRRWSSPLGAHVYLSTARGFGGGLARLGGLSLVAGVASAQALQALGFSGVRLKWPNDLVVAGADGWRKLGGLLVEAGGEHAAPVRAVVGLGLNVRMPAAVGVQIQQPWCDLATLASAEGCGLPSRNELAATLLAYWLPALEAFDEAGLASFLPRYAALDALAGQSVVVDSPGMAGRRQYQGVVLGLSNDGALRLRLDDGEERVLHAGEIRTGGDTSVRRVAP